MNHLDEMAGAGRPTIQVPFLSCTGGLIAPWRAGEIAASRRKRLKDWIQAPDGLSLTSDHQTVTTLETPHTAAGPDVDVMNTSRFELFGASDVVDIVGVASIHDRVALLHLGTNAMQRVIDRRGGHHQPRRARRL